MEVRVHPTAQIAASAQIAGSAVIGAYAIIENNVTIGEGTRIDAHACIKTYTKMGANNHVHTFACVGGEPQDLKFAGEESWLIIGDNNNIREFSTIHRGTEGGGGFTRIGNNNLFMAYTHIAHDCQVGSHIVMSNNATLAGHVTVMDHVIIGGMSAVHQFARLGRYAFVGGMSGITQDVPPYMLAVGNRAWVRSPNLVGLRRLQANKESIAAVKNAFKALWFSETPRKETLEQLLYEHADIPEVVEIVAFIKSSERGIISARHTDEE